MSPFLPSCIAGPSRLPFISLIRSAPSLRPLAVRAYATALARPDQNTPQSIDPQLAQLENEEYEDEEEDDDDEYLDGTGERSERFGQDLSAEERQAKSRLENFWASKEGFELWKVTDGVKYRQPAPDGKAHWLGISTPYPNNPSFRPLPPLSNGLMDVVYGEIRGAKRSIQSLSVEYNISKARIAAIRKLKEVEDEMRRQKLPLQEAFQQGMETLLGVKTPRRAGGREIDQQRLREIVEGGAGLLEQRIEAEEEARYDAGTGETGAFGERSAEKMAKREPLERAVFEFRDEQEVVEARGREAIRQNAIKAARRAATRPDGTIDESKLLDIPAQEPFPTPGTLRTARSTARAIKEHTARREAASGKKEGTVYRVHATKAYRFQHEKIPQEWRTEQRQRRRVKKNEKAAARRVAMYGPLPTAATRSKRTAS